MSNWTFCPITGRDGYQRVEGYEGDGEKQLVVLACGHKPPVFQLTYGIDEVTDNTITSSSSVTAVVVPIAAAIAAAETLEPTAEWHDVVEQAQADGATVLVQTEVAPDE